MLPRMHRNYTIVDSLIDHSSGDGSPRCRSPKSRDQLAKTIYEQHHNRKLPLMVGALKAAEAAVRFVEQAKVRQECYFSRAEMHHQQRYQQMCESKPKPDRRLGKPSVSYLTPIGQNFGFPEKRCFDMTQSKVAYAPKIGDGTVRDSRVGDYGQQPSAGERTSDDHLCFYDKNVLHLKYFR